MASINNFKDNNARSALTLVSRYYNPDLKSQNNDIIYALIMESTHFNTDYPIKCDANY